MAAEGSGKQVYPGSAHRRPLCRKRVAKVDGAAGTFQHRNVKPLLCGIKRGIGDAVIGGEADQHQLGNAPGGQVAAEPGGGYPVILKQGRIAVDRPAKAFADNQLRAIGAQVGMECRALRALNAMAWPQGLLAIGHVNLSEGLMARMGFGKGAVVKGVPVLRQDHGGEIIHRSVDPQHDFVTSGHSKGAAGAEIVLHVDHDQGFIGGAHGGSFQGGDSMVTGGVGWGQALVLKLQKPYAATMLTVTALYHFTRFEDPAALRQGVLQCCLANEVKGSLLLAAEGINGTIAGTRDGVSAVLKHLSALPGCEGLEWKESAANSMPFGRMKVRIKREIVTMGQPDIDPKARVGHYVVPEDWNDLISAPDVVVIDTRNQYEVQIGTFQGAIDPGTHAFREFPAWWQANKDRFHNKRIAMFCTGGIRCEKSTNYLLGQGVSEVFHLKGGILKYLEEVPETASLWQGECFVFDERVSVGHRLKPGDFTACRACRRPLSVADRASALYENGVRCPQCIDEYDESDRARFRERQYQMDLAAARGQRHLG